jgi:CHAT domain-containing protein/tetratricopeptide (TPR) repeat protein
MSAPDERFTALLAIIPGAAQPADIEEGESLLRGITESEIDKRFALLLKLGSFYLETKVMNPAEAADAAGSCYERAAAISGDNQNAKWMAASGYANVLARRYELSRSVEDFNAAASFYDGLIDMFEQHDLVKETNSIRSNYAIMLSHSTHGDRFSNNDRAITLLRQVVSSISPEVRPEQFDPDQYARALYNLGAALLGQVEDPHVQNLYFNEAVDRFYQALNYRTADHDPVGRAKVLRALAMVLPEYEGAASREHARQLADAATAEAEALEAGAMPQKAPWAEVMRQESALYWDMDDVAQHRADMLAAIDNHVNNIEKIPKDHFPYMWAEWVGGYARLLGRMGNEDSDSTLLQRAHAAFVAAIEMVPEDRDPRLCVILYREFGRMCHERGDWKDSLHMNSKAVAIGLPLSDGAGTNVSRTAELESFTRSIHFAAYAASMLDLTEQAAEFAEIGRGRWLDDAICIAAIRRSELPAEFKAAADKAQARLLELERREYVLQGQGFGGALRGLENYLGAAIGGVIKARATADPDKAEEQLRQELAGVRRELQEVHEDLGVLLNSISDDQVPSRRPSCGRIKAITKKMGFPVVYLLSTAWGTSLIIVGKKVEVLLVDTLTRNLVQDLLGGANGYLWLSADQSRGDLESSLTAIQELLDKHLIPPLVEWCRNNCIASIAIVGLGDIGLLPIQVATVPTGLTVRLLPSARVLDISPQDGTAVTISKTKLLTVGGVISNNLPLLDFSRIESACFAEAFQKAGAEVSRISMEATLNNIETAIQQSNYLHFSVHGSFTSFSPLNSVVHLNGDEVLPVETLLRPALKLAGIQLVILSACNSASSEFWRTPDEAIGFPAAFLAAGAKTVIAAQWPVGDVPAFLLMQRFCSELLNHDLDAASSLANAQNWVRSASATVIQKTLNEIREGLGEEELSSKHLLRDLEEEVMSMEHDIPFADRRHWAAFVCVGV